MNKIIKTAFGVVLKTALTTGFIAGLSIANSYATALAGFIKAYR